MRGRKVYEYALRKVPALLKDPLTAGLDIKDIRKVLLKQCQNDHAMVQRLFKLYDIDEIPDDIAPMTCTEIRKFGQ